MSEFWVHCIRGASSAHIQYTSKEDAITAARELATVPEVNNIRVRGVEGEIPWRVDHVEPPKPIPATFRAREDIPAGAAVYLAPKDTPLPAVLTAPPSDPWTLF